MVFDGAKNFNSKIMVRFDKFLLVFAGCVLVVGLVRRRVVGLRVVVIRGDGPSGKKF